MSIARITRVMCACQLPHTKMLRIGMIAFEQLKMGQVTGFDIG